MLILLRSSIKIVFVEEDCFSHTFLFCVCFVCASAWRFNWCIGDSTGVLDCCDSTGVLACKVQGVAFDRIDFC